MVGDEGAVVALDHDDAGVVVGGDDAKGHVGEDGADDAGVAKGAEVTSVRTRAAAGRSRDQPRFPPVCFGRDCRAEKSDAMTFPDPPRIAAAIRVAVLSAAARIGSAARWA